MSTMIEVRTADLIGPALDWAVAKADGLPLSEEACQDDFILIGTGFGDLERFNPSTNWSQGGPLIEKHRLRAHPARSEGAWSVGWCFDSGVWNPRFEHWQGESLLIAACRAIVAAKLGDMVSVPADLVQGGDA